MINQTQLREAHMRAVYVGLFFNLLVPILFIVAGYGVRRLMYADAEPWTVAPESLDVIFWALLVVAVGEIPVALLLRKLLLKPGMRSAETDDPTTALTVVLSRFVVLFAMALSPAVYGFVYYLLGGSFREFVLFALVSLVIYRLVRPSQEFFYSLFGARPAGVE